ncbi:hypothetical protein [Ferrimonas sp.]|uniref:hypothetical protein n=1 Tax=Ferrimonas sp. TaxID=2080861 RepID=UPI003A93DC2B
MELIRHLRRANLSEAALIRYLVAGQGLIKYLAMFSVALYLFAHLGRGAGVDRFSQISSL